MIEFDCAECGFRICALGAEQTAGLGPLRALRVDR